MNTVYGWKSFSELPSNSTISIVGTFAGGIGNGFNGANVDVKESVKITNSIQNCNLF